MQLRSDRFHRFSGSKSRPGRYAPRMDLETVKRIPLEQLLERLGYQPDRRQADTLWYKSPFRQEATASFNVSQSKNLWYDFGIGEGGSAIDLVMRLQRLDSVSDAASAIATLIGGDAIEEPRALVSASKRDAIEILDVGALRAPRLLSYIRARGIRESIAKLHLREVHYKIGAKAFYALGFQNDSGGYELRNPHFKGSTSKDISTIQGSPNRVFCFEGFFDYLSLLCLLNGELPGTASILNSVSLKKLAFERIRGLRPTVIDLYFDDDPAGHSLVREFKQELPEPTIVDWHDLYRGHGDLNAWWISRELRSYNHQPYDNAFA